MKVMAVIQNEKGLKNAREIIKETDIVVLKRSFLATAMSVEKVYNQFKNFSML